MGMNEMGDYGVYIPGLRPTCLLQSAPGGLSSLLVAPLLTNLSIAKRSDPDVLDGLDDKLFSPACPTHTWTAWAAWRGMLL
jgi:hypothetical protein